MSCLDEDVLEPVSSRKIYGFTTIETVGEASVVCFRERDNVLARLLVEFVTGNSLLLHMGDKLAVVNDTCKTCVPVSTLSPTSWHRVARAKHTMRRRGDSIVVMWYSRSGE